MIEAVKRSIERVKPQIPADVKLEVIRDQSRYIYAALHEINVHLVLGSILACLVVFAFMRNWRATRDRRRRDSRVGHLDASA